MIKRANFLLVLSFVVLLAGSFFFSGCETSRVGPEVAVNVPPPAPAAMLLQGVVFNSKTNAGIAGATVKIQKTDGTAIATVATDGNGAFSYDISSLTNTAYKIIATATGFGSSFANAKADPVNRTSDVVVIPLDPIVSVAVTLTPAGGGAATTTNTESKTNSTVNISVPANAVTTNTTVSIAAIPVNNVPPPVAAATTSQVGVTNITPAGVTFAKAITMTYPLPYQMNSGDLIPVQEYVNGAWQATTLNAKVDASGLNATLDLTKTGQFSLVDNTVVSGTFSGLIVNQDGTQSVTPALYKDSKTLETREVLLTGSKMITLPLTRTVSITYTKGSPALTWILNVLRQRYGAGISSPGTQTIYQNITITWPGVPASLTNPNGTGNRNFPNDTGTWYLKVTLSSSTRPTNLRMSNGNYIDITYTDDNPVWNITGFAWVWVGHNQGATYTSW